MQMLGLEAHEIFSFMGIVYTILAAHGIYHLLNNVLNVSKRYAAIIAFVVVMNFSWRDLLVLQYVPQILGISCLIMFIAEMIEYFCTGKKRSMILASLFLVATASAYAEFASYMFIIYLGIVVIQCICTKQWWRTIREAVSMGLLAIAFNPLGFLIAVKFNLNILMQVSASPSNIDAYGGNIMSFKNIIGQLMGGPEVRENMYGTWVYRIYMLMLFVLAGLFCVSVIYMVLKSHKKQRFFLLWILIFFIAYEMYFHGVRLAYGEYKHLISIAAILTAIILYFIYEFEHGHKYKILLGISMALMLIMDSASMSHTYPEEAILKYDESLMEIKEGLDMIPSTEEVGILGNHHFKQHLLIYAAKDVPIRLMGEGVNSYYTMLGISLNNDIPNYVLCMKNTEELDTVLAGSYKEIWQNESYMLVETQ